MLDYDTLLNWPFPEIVAGYTADSAILYALGLGFGQDPTDEGQLRFVYEERLRAVPTMPVIFCHPGQWVQAPELGLDWRRIVHADQKLVLHRPLRASGEVIGRTRNTAVIDKGEGRGAIILQRRDLSDAQDGGLIATIDSAYFARGDGGFSRESGRSDAPPPPPAPMPAASADHGIDMPVQPQAALIYRLSGDRNPVHADPGLAAATGLPRPMLHGLCTWGMAGHAVLRLCCGYDPDRLRMISGRFTAPMFPGETLRVEIWTSGPEVRFRASSIERGLVVLDHGIARIAPEPGGCG